MTAQLFTPVEVGGVTLPNRIVVSPMCQYSSVDGSAQPWHQVHYGMLSMSGAENVVMASLERSSVAGFVSASAIRKTAETIGAQLHFKGQLDAPAGTVRLKSAVSRTDELVLDMGGTRTVKRKVS